MNQNKKNNGWILCPSKTFPGKFYYFNVVNGEAAWSLNEIENPSLRRDYRIHKVADKSHSFPEPSSPPMDETPNFSFSNNTSFKKPNHTNLPKRVINNTQTPMFGQAIFPKYVEPYMPNVIWTPIQLPPAMYYPNSPYMGMKMPFDSTRQSCDPEHSLFVQSCDLSLSKRFEMYSKSPCVKPNAEKMRDLSNKFYDTSTPIKSSLNEKVMTHSQIFGLKENTNFEKPREDQVKSFIRQPILKRVRTVSDSENDPKVLWGIYKTNSAESLTNIDKSALMKPTLSGCEKAKNSKEKLDDLDRDDLRYLLVAKRRKSVDLEDTQIHSESNKIKTTKDDVPKTNPKKRVTFYLEDQACSDGANDQTEQNIATPEEVSPTDQDIEDCLLYIAADLDTLLDEFEFLDKYTQADDSRRLLIPQKLQSEIEAATHGDCCSRQRVVAARQITRKLVAPPPHYVILPESGDSPNSVQCLTIDNNSDNYILNACLMVLDAGDQVMLVTNNSELYNDAKTLKIDCFKPQELKDGSGVAKPEVSFDLKKIPHDTPKEKSTNLFLQPASEFEPYLVKNKEEIPGNTFKKRLFEENVAEKIILPKNKNNFKDANTSPMNTDFFSDKLIYITRKKLPNMPLLDTTEIGLDMQNLFIKEKPNSATEKQTTNVRYENRTIEKRKDAKQKVFEPSRNDATEKRNVRFENGIFEKIKEKQKGFEPESTDRNSLDELLSVYTVKNVDMVENIKIRIDEWICCFTQIMEDALVEVLMNRSPITDKQSPPWVLYESVRRIQDLYGSHTDLVMVTAKFKDILLNHSSKSGKLKTTIKPNDLVKIVGCGMVLIETLKSIVNSTPLYEASNSLASLLQGMSQPPLDIPLFTTPVLTREETVQENRTNHIKKPSEIIEYLKAHYSDWKDYEIPPDFDERQPKILRTTGRDLNLFKIDNNKSITLKTRNPNSNEYIADGTQSSNKIDGISAIEQTKPTLGGNGFTKSPIVFRKFDSSFILKSDKKKLTSTKNNTNNIDSVDDNKAIETKDFSGPKAIENKDEITITRPNNNVLANDNSKNEPKIIRIFDNLFKENNEKSTTKIDDDLNVSKHGNTFNQNAETAGPKVIRTFNGLFMPKNKEKSIATEIIQELNVPKHGNTFDEITETAGPKVIRNIKPIKAFEGKLKENPIMLDLDPLDYSDEKSETTDAIDNDSTEDAVSFVYAIKKQERKSIFTKCNEGNIAEINDNAQDNVNEYTQKSIDIINNNNVDDSVNNFSLVNNESDDKSNLKDDTNDSGFENENIRAYSLVKIFLTEICKTVKAIYEFIVKSLNEICEDEIQEEKRRILHEKANRTQMTIARIINELKSIIQREGNEGSLVKSVLLKAGVQASADKRMTRYRQVVTKCLEQAQLLENALKTVLVLTKYDIDVSISSDHSNIRYFNIFE